MEATTETLGNTTRELVSKRTLAHLLDVNSIRTIEGWVQDGKIPYVKLPTGGIRFEIRTIRNWWGNGRSK